MLVSLLRRTFRRLSLNREADSERLSPDRLKQHGLPESSEQPDDLIAAASALAQRGELIHAKELLQQALLTEPDNADAHDVLGSVLRTQGEPELALASYQRALELDPQRVSAHSNIALCMRDFGRYDEAREHYQQAVRLDPANPVVSTNFAALLFDMGQFEEASERIGAVLREHPDNAEAHFVRGTRLLRRGDWAEGWREYERRDRNAGRTDPHGFGYPVWDGSPLAHGHLLVCSEQGLGDQIMFASCLDDLLRVVPSCIVECDARLKPLFARSFPSIRFYVRRTEREEAWLRDGMTPLAQTWLGSLPGRFRNSVLDFPGRCSYLQPERSKTNMWRERLQALGPGLKVGISWRGGTGSTRRALRSIALEDWLPLLRCPNMYFVSLQYGDCQDEIERTCAKAGVRITHWNFAIQDYEETAALVSALDLVISVQTAVVHLAGALGTPVWVLVPSVAEWRYGESGRRMPWYPPARLYRQNEPGSWNEVLSRIQKALIRVDAPGP